MKFEKLGNIADLIAGQSPPSSSYNKNGTGVPFFQGKADYGLINPTVRSWCSEPNKISLPGDILISVRAPVGPVNINNVEACIGRGLSAIRVKDNISRDYVYFYLKINEGKISKLGVGSTFNAITQKDLKEIFIPLPNYSSQQYIANILTKAENLISQRKESILLLDEYLKSTFLEMFGDNSTNKKKWSRVELNQFGKITTGNTPPRNNSNNYSSHFIEWIKTDNITTDKIYITKATEYLSEYGLKNARTVENGALLIACIAGSIESIGRSSLTDRKVSFNQQINAIQPNEFVHPLFLYWLFKTSKHYVQNHATKGMKKILIKGEFEKINMIKPPFNLQSFFAKIVEKTEGLKIQYKNSLVELDNLYGSLSQKAFRGELSFKDEKLMMAAEPEIDYMANP
jgi:type I restriction enzyme S subunit